MGKAVVIGGGPAGMMAACQAARKGHKVILLEKNEKLGKKLYITGKGRCNLTNACETEELFKQVMRNRKFLYAAFYGFSNGQVVDFFESRGLATKVERGGRVFPQSDHSSDVIRTLQRTLQEAGVEVRLHTQAGKVLEASGQEGGGRRIRGVMLGDGRLIEADAVVVATGGCSYMSTGSTGDGYRFAEELGHTVTERRPSLVPFEAAEGWVKELQGLSLRNVAVCIRKEKKVLFQEFGEMLFTHYGVSGPLLLSASSAVNDYMHQMPLSMEIDLKPALSREQLDKRVLRDFGENKNRQFKNALQKLFPTKLIPVMVSLSGIHPDKKVNEVTKEERGNFIRLIKAFPITLSRFRGFDEAIITRGGIEVKEVNPSTMESKLVKGLYFAGEALDLDAQTGGFNLQIAWSTGYLAGDSI
ncbi:MAG: NAD(P)/FAD-dependent oxidoreductase [Lachnospiraceae bacterium]|jgi:predicted Rossmann fold flavoprotein|nr:NAD(P)/FAD-dependent oxidoreductase [Lachnospiraceae bacterium]